jgi:hypothetical protein
MADKERGARATSAGDASAGSGSSGPDNSAPTETSEDGRTRASGRGEVTEVTDTTPTTAEEAMDDAGAGDGFVDESAYAPTDR